MVRSVLVWNRIYLCIFVLLLSGKALAQESVYQLDNPGLSHRRGFYKEAFLLNISSNYLGAEILYTLDGSDPLISLSATKKPSPAVVEIDPNLALNLGGKTPCIILRAAVLADGKEASEIVSHSYIFPEAVISQSDPGGSWNEPQGTYAWPGYEEPQSIDYGMDEKITQDAAYSDRMMDALSSIPSFSVISRYEDMFGKDSGIFMNALELGWERPASIEMIDPLTGEDFQIDAGIRMRGRYSRLPRNPKHSFRLFFRKEYGEAKLRYPIFGNEGTNEFDHLDFRCAQNSSWNAENGNEETVTFLKEVLARDIQGKMGMHYTRSRYCHLYLNGMYWGLFQIHERADDHFAETYMGGDKSEYDVIKPQQNVTVPVEDLKIGANAGTLDIAMALWDSTIQGNISNEDYYALQGMHPDGSDNPELDPLLDMENLMDYLLIAFYMGSKDGPGVIWQSLWGHTIRPNNFIGIYNRVQPEGFQWIVHDFEKGMYNKNDSWPLLISDDTWFSTDFEFFNPLTVHRRLMENEEYKVKLADRVYRHFSSRGVFDPAYVHELTSFRKSQINDPVLAESARWGDWISWRPVQTPAHWENNVSVLLNNYIPDRTGIVMGQFTSAGLDFSVDPPEMKYQDEEISFGTFHVNNNEEILFNDPNTTPGEIYFTINGSDPRAAGGTIAGSAARLENNTGISITSNSRIMTRIFRDNIWSPLSEAVLFLSQDISGLQVTELHYHPLEQDTVGSNRFEFLELKNTGAVEIDLTGFSFTDGITCTIDTAFISPGEFYVLASDTAMFRSRYGFAAHAQYEGYLRNSGEKIVISNAMGENVLELIYSDDTPWPLAADGAGNSLVAANINPEGNPSDPSYWRASTFLGGSPAADDPEPSPGGIRINEVLSNTEAPQVDRIELYNPSDQAVDISYWFLTDDRDSAMKWQIPAGTTIPASAYMDFSAGHYDGEILKFDMDEFGSAFLISSLGEDLYLFEADQDSVLSGYVHGIQLSASEKNISKGAFTNSLGETYFVAMAEQSFGDENSAPLVGPLVISEIMYHPSDGNYEYLKLRNISRDTISLIEGSNSLGWRLEGIDFKFEDAVSLNPGDSLYVMENGIEVEAFRSLYHINSATAIFEMRGRLSNAGETITLLKAAPRFINENIIYNPFIPVESVTFLDEEPWDPLADGSGYALRRKDENSFANDPLNWEAKMIPVWPQNAAVQSLQRELFSMYPNPVHNLLTIRPLEQTTIEEVIITDISGRVLFKSQNHEDLLNLDFSLYHPGLYLVSVRCKGQIETKRVIRH